MILRQRATVQLKREVTGNVQYMETRTVLQILNGTVPTIITCQQNYRAHIEYFII